MRYCQRSYDGPPLRRCSRLLNEDPQWIGKTELEYDHYIQPFLWRMARRTAEPLWPLQTSRKYVGEVGQGTAFPCSLTPSRPSESARRAYDQATSSQPRSRPNPGRKTVNSPRVTM